MYVINLFYTQNMFLQVLHKLVLHSKHALRIRRKLVLHSKHALALCSKLILHPKHACPICKKLVLHPKHALSLRSKLVWHLKHALPICTWGRSSFRARILAMKTRGTDLVQRLSYLLTLESFCIYFGQWWPGLGHHHIILFCVSYKYVFVQLWMLRSYFLKIIISQKDSLSHPPLAI